MGVRVTAVVAAAAVLVAMSGCASQPPTQPTPLPTASPAATAEPVVTLPTSRLGIECEDLVTAETVTARIAGAVPRPDYFADILAQSPGIPEGTPLLQAGGLVCDWSAMTAVAGNLGQPAGYTGLHIELLPDAASYWATYTDSVGIPSTGFWYCSNYGALTGPFCNFEALVGTTWVSIQLSGVDAGTTDSDEVVAAKVRPFVDAIVAVIAEAGFPAAPWVDPSAAVIPGTCEQVLPIATVAEGVGIASLADYETASTPFGAGFIGLLSTAARLSIGEVRCPWGYGYETEFGGLRLIPGGSWALSQTIDDPSPAGPAVRVKIDGLGSDDAAWLRCAAADGACVLDVSIGRNWLEVFLWQPTDLDGNTVPMDRQAVLQKLAESAVDNLN